MLVDLLEPAVSCATFTPRLSAPTTSIANLAYRAAKQ
jgi:hypothetical protein